MIKHLLSSAFLFLVISLSGQEYVQVPVGPSYSQQSYYRLSDDKTITIDNTDWDLAFTTGVQDAGILYNESAKVSFTGAPPELKLYIADTEDFTDVIDPSTLTDSSYNSALFWQDGAFNSFRDTSNVFDFGWGEYVDRAIKGTYIFVIKLRDDSWKKIKIDSLKKGIYYVKYADLDGQNENTFTVDKAEYRDHSPFAFFSFNTEELVTGPGEWDLFFGRYVEPIDPGNGTITNYTVTGVLSAEGVEVVEIFDTEPDDVVLADYVDSFKNDRIDIIGQDWKYFDLSSGWVIDEERSYLIKQFDGHVWKIVFVDFTGSKEGIYEFEKTDFGFPVAVEDPTSNFNEMDIFPNPNIGKFTFTFSLKNNIKELPVFVINSLGEKIWSTTLIGRKGLNAYNIDLPKLITGSYQLISGTGDDLQSKSIHIK